MRHFRKDHGQDRPRRVYYNQSDFSGLGNRPISFLSIDEFRNGDDWIFARDRLSQIVQKELLSTAPQVTPGSVSWHDVWASIVPSVIPSHWITVGWRDRWIKAEKVNVVQIPVSLGRTEDVIAIAGQVFFAIDALSKPKSLESIEKRDRAVLSITLFWTIAIAVREDMRSRYRGTPFG
jgi:hypothetical protein